MEITVIRSSRKTMALQVKPDGSVVVRAPGRMPMKEIRSFVDSHQDWIRKQLGRVAKAQEERVGTEKLTEAELRALGNQAVQDLAGRCRYWAPRVGVSYGRITVRNQKTRWGSCSAKGNLNFNCLLMLAPESVRDYVVVHELCHRKHMDHSPAFWQAVEEVCPGWREAKAWLRENGQALMMKNPIA